MAWMETDYSKHTHFRWKIKWRLEHLGALGIMGTQPGKGLAAQFRGTTHSPQFLGRYVYCPLYARQISTSEVGSIPGKPQNQYKACLALAAVPEPQALSTSKAFLTNSDSVAFFDRWSR